MELFAYAVKFNQFCPNTDGTAVPHKKPVINEISVVDSNTSTSVSASLIDLAIVKELK
jgi:hypothetical protein